MRQSDGNKNSLLLLVEYQTEQQFREALVRLPIRHPSEWRCLDQDDGGTSSSN